MINATGEVVDRTDEFENGSEFQVDPEGFKEVFTYLAGSGMKFSMHLAEQK
ncbi:MAG: hypothetical protein LYZ69_02600 [Nitrososphaerales archaeon]|nr:hypothetical protein [Nitrososphaerales archaeon]